MIMTEELKSAFNILSSIKDKGFDAYIVGGSVRDIIMGIEPNDIDIVSNIPISILSKMYQSYDIGKSKDFNIHTIINNGFSFEVANYRTDIYNSITGYGANKTLISSSIKDDSCRRDFTCNSLYMDINGNIVDFHNGESDIINRIIRTVGSAEKRFSEDYIRIIRCIRFAARYDFEIESSTVDAIKKFAYKIPECVSAERIWQEIVKMASGRNFWKAVKMMDEYGILEHIIPEVSNMDRYPHNPKWHPEGNLFQHTIEVLKVLDNEPAIYKIAGWFHDIGKPATFAMKDSNPTYYGHGSVGLKVFEKVAKRLKISNSEKNVIDYAIEQHMKIHSFMEMKDSTCFKIMDSEHWDMLKVVSYADDKSRGYAFDMSAWEDINKKIDRIYISVRNKKNIDSVVNGRTVIEHTNIPAGPKMGEVISKTKSYVIDNNIDITTDDGKNDVINYMKSFQ